MEKVVTKPAEPMKIKFPSSPSSKKSQTVSRKKPVKKSSKSSGSSKKIRAYRYIKQGKICKKIIHSYKTKKCRHKKTKKCRSLQKKRNTCKKIVKRKRAMAKRSRKLQKLAEQNFYKKINEKYAII